MKQEEKKEAREIPSDFLVCECGRKTVADNNFQSCADCDVMDGVFQKHLCCSYCQSDKKWTELCIKNNICKKCSDNMFEEFFKPTVERNMKTFLKHEHLYFDAIVVKSAMARLVEPGLIWSFSDSSGYKIKLGTIIPNKDHYLFTPLLEATAIQQSTVAYLYEEYNGYSDEPLGDAEKNDWEILYADGTGLWDGEN